MRVDELLKEAKTLLSRVSLNISQIEINSTNEPLDEPEHLRLKFLASHTTKFQAEIELMDKGTSSAESVSRTLTNLRRKRIGHVHGLQVALAPHKKLPPELLSKIFLHGLDRDGLEIPPHLGLVPWNVIRVCSAWRRIALKEQGLWSKIQIYLWDNKARLTLQHVLNRTTQSTLDFTIFDEGRRARRFMNNFIVPHAPRIRTLSLHTHSGRLATQILSLQEGNFNSLEALDMARTSFPGSGPSLFERTPALRKFRFTGAKMSRCYPLVPIDTSGFVSGDVHPSSCACRIGSVCIFGRMHAGH